MAGVVSLSRSRCQSLGALDELPAIAMYSISASIEPPSASRLLGDFYARGFSSTRIRIFSVYFRKEDPFLFFV